MPEVRPRPLYREQRKGFAKILGLDPLPDACLNGIVWLIAEHKASCRVVKGHTPAKVAAGLRRIESRLRRGHDTPDAVREITDPQFGLDVESFTRLQNVFDDPEVPLDQRLAMLEARRREVEALPEVEALYGLRVMLVGLALVWVWCYFAVRPDDGARQWQFVLATLKAAGEGTEGVRKNPGRLKRDIGRLLELTAEPGRSA